MKKTFVSISLSLLLASPVMADAVSDKPPEFKPSAATLERAQKLEQVEQDALKTAKKTQKEATLVFPDGHDPRDHDHDHDDAADLDHDHDDPKTHEKQLKAISEQGEEQSGSWWPF
jgi:hypothetical protein